MAETTQTTQEPSGKPSKAGIYPVCHGAECMCDKSNEQKPNGIFEVKTQSTVYVNDKDGADKLVGTTKDLPLPFETKAKTFGTCKMQPMGSSYKPCVPNIVQWEKSYEAIKLPNQGTALIKESEGICSFGGKITFETHGQTQTVTQVDLEETAPEIAAVINEALSEEVVEQLQAGTFDDNDDETIGVKDIVTTDNQSPVSSGYTYHESQSLINFKVSKPITMTAQQKAGINWVVYEKRGTTYKELYTFVDKGDVFDFPYRTAGIYAVEAYGKSKTFNVNTGKGGAYNLVHIKYQELANNLKLTVAGQDRTVAKRIRPTETATISASMLFPSATPLKPRNIYWEVTSGGKTVEFTKVKGVAQITLPPQGNTTTKTITVTVSCDGISASPLTFKIGANYVKNISADKETICVLNKGEQENERHKATFSVESYAIEPANDAEKALVKWIAYDNAPKIENQVGTGHSFTKTADTEGEWYVEAYVNTPEGKGKATTKQIKAIQPKITKAYWADKNGNSISKSGYGHQVYIHIETEGLQGEKLKLNVWESDTYSSDFIKNAGTDIEITEANGIINQAFTLPESHYYEQEYYFTIEKLDVKVIATKQDSDSNNEYLLWRNHQTKKVHYLYVNNKQKIVNFKIYETGDKLHVGAVTFGDTVTIKISTRNYLEEILEFEIWKDAKFNNNGGGSEETRDDDIKFKETISVKIDKEGNGETTFTIPANWKDYQTTVAQVFYFKEIKSGVEFPRAYYIANPNTKEKDKKETKKQNSNRIIALMLKVSNSKKFDTLAETNSAVILGEELTAGADDDCKGRNCIRLGAESKLIQEINIRLAGFGGNVPTKKFTPRTVTMVKQFQKDYMEIEPTGNICGDTLKAIDEFSDKYTFPFEEIKCKCGVCSGFGQGRKSNEKQDDSIAESRRNYEYPGIHRSLLWGYKASLFYLPKESELNYETHSVNSGYRCHNHSIYKNSGTTNHCGKALDILYNHNGGRTKKKVHIEEIRKKIFNKYLKAKWDWNAEKNIFYLESTGKGATTWIHVDVREFNLEYLKDEFFAKTETKMNGKKVVGLAKEEGFSKTCDCLGSFTSPQGASSSANGSENRVDPKNLNTSDKGIQFIKDWEKFEPNVYDDSEGYATIGYGHLIARKSKNDIIISDEFKNGITEAKATELFKSRLVDFEKALQQDITVNLYQYEFDALVSLLFNTGSQFLNVGGANNGETKIKKNINLEKYSEGADEMNDVTNRGTSGLVKRRKAEINMFKNNVYDSTH